jgi:hypothetical protein
MIKVTLDEYIEKVKGGDVEFCRQLFIEMATLGQSAMIMADAARDRAAKLERAMSVIQDYLAKLQPFLKRIREQYPNEFRRAGL